MLVLFHAAQTYYNDWNEAEKEEEFIIDKYWYFGTVFLSLTICKLSRIVNLDMLRNAYGGATKIILLNYGFKDTFPFITRDFFFLYLLYKYYMS